MNNTIEDQEISLVDLVGVIKKWFQYFLSQWKILLFVGLIGGGIGYYYAWSSKVTYTAKMNFVVEEAKSGGGGGLAALAGSFGFDIGGGSSNLVSGENIIGLLASHRMVRATLLSPFNASGNQTMADRYAEVQKSQKGWTKKFGKPISFSSGKIFDRVQDSLLKLMVEGIIKSELTVIRKDKKMSFIEVNTTMADEELAAQFTKRLMNETVEFYIETKTRRSRANVDRLQHRADSIGLLLNIQTSTAATVQSQSLDINPAFSKAAVSREISVRDKTMLATIYAEVVKSLEIQKASLTQETPVIQVVDEIQSPLQKNKKSKLQSLIAGGFIAGFLGVFILFIRKWWREQSGTVAAKA